MPDSAHKSTFFRDDALAFDGFIYFMEVDTDPELMHYALAEVGLLPDDGGGGWLGWDRDLSKEGYAMVQRAEQLVRLRPEATQ